MIDSFGVKGTGGPPSRSHIRSTMEAHGYGEARLVRVDQDPEDPTRVVVTVDNGSSDRLSERMLEEASVEQRKLPTVAATYPNEPESYWRAVRADQEARRIASNLVAETDVPADLWPWGAR